MMCLSHILNLNFKCQHNLKLVTVIAFNYPHLHQIISKESNLKPLLQKMVDMTTISLISFHNSTEIYTCNKWQREVLDAAFVIFSFTYHFRGYMDFFGRLLFSLPCNNPVYRNKSQHSVKKIEQTSIG